MKAATRNRITAIGMVVLFAVVALVVIERSCIRTVPIGVVSPARPAPGSEDSLSFIALDRKPAVFPFVDVVSWREEEAEPEGETEETFSFRLVVRTKKPEELERFKTRVGVYFGFYHGKDCVGTANLREVLPDGVLRFSADENDRGSLVRALDYFAKKNESTTFPGEADPASADTATP